eukprot:22869_1
MTIYERYNKTQIYRSLSENWENKYDIPEKYQLIFEVTQTCISTQPQIVNKFHLVNTALNRNGRLVCRKANYLICDSREIMIPDRNTFGKTNNSNRIGGMKYERIMYDDIKYHELIGLEYFDLFKQEFHMITFVLIPVNLLYNYVTEQNYYEIRHDKCYKNMTTKIIGNILKKKIFNDEWCKDLECKLNEMNDDNDEPKLLLFQHQCQECHDNLFERIEPNGSREINIDCFENRLFTLQLNSKHPFINRKIYGNNGICSEYKNNNDIFCKDVIAYGEEMTHVYMTFKGNKNNVKLIYNGNCKSKCNDNKIIFNGTIKISQQQTCEILMQKISKQFFHNVISANDSINKNDCWDIDMSLRIESELSEKYINKQQESLHGSYVDNYLDTASDSQIWLLSLIQSLLTSIFIWQPLLIFISTLLKVLMFTWHMPMDIGLKSVYIVCIRCCGCYNYKYNKNEKQENEGDEGNQNDNEKQLNMLKYELKVAKVNSKSNVTHFNETDNEIDDERIITKKSEFIANSNRPLDAIGFLSNDQLFIDDYDIEIADQIKFMKPNKMQKYSMDVELTESNEKKK